MQRGYIPSFRRSRSSPKLRWAESGPAEHPERVDFRYYDEDEPSSSFSASVSESTDTISSRSSRTPARRILKPARTDPFEWPMRSRARASSFTDEPMDWELATMDYEPKVLIGREDSQAALKAKKKQKQARKKGEYMVPILREHISPEKREGYIRDWFRTDENCPIMEQTGGIIVKHPEFSVYKNRNKTKSVQRRLKEEFELGHTTSARKRPLKNVPPMKGLFEIIPTPD